MQDYKQERLYDIKNTASQFSDIDRMAVNDENEINSLLSYYRDRINDFENERTEWLEKLEKVRLNQEEKHKLEWELQKRKDEIVELQKFLTESKVVLFDERQLVLRLTRENDQLKLKEQEDRKKIQELLSLTEPIEEEVFLQKDLRPGFTHKFAKNDHNIHQNKENYQNVMKKFGGSSTGHGGGAGKSVVKTIYMPNENLNQISQENSNLKKQLELERNTFQEQIYALKQELQIKEDEMRMRYNLDSQKLEEFQNFNQKLEQKHLGLTKEFFQLRFKCNKSEQQLHEENELLRLRNTALANKLVIVQKQSEVELRANQELVEKRSEEYTNKFRNQTMKKEDQIQVMKNQYDQAQKIYLGKVKELEQSLAKLAEKLQRKQQVEGDSYKNEIRVLSKKLDQAEMRDYDDDQDSKHESLTQQEKINDEVQRQKNKHKKDTKKIYGGKSQKQGLKKKKRQQRSEQIDEESDDNDHDQNQDQDEHSQVEPEDQNEKSGSVKQLELDQLKNQLAQMESWQK